MAKRKVFVSFDFENDRQYKYTLNMWNANPEFEFTFEDRSTREINSWNIPVIKAALTRKINEATYTFVIIGKDANKRHPDYIEIGFRNWQNFEINRSKQNGNKLVAIQLNSIYEYPEELVGAGAVRVREFKQEAILDALRKLR